MRQMYYCTQCGYPVAFADSFCSRCGVNLKWVVLQDTPADTECHQPGYSGNTLPPKSDVSSGGDVIPLSAGISRLLSDFFDKRTRQDKVSQTQ